MIFSTGFTLGMVEGDHERSVAMDQPVPSMSYSLLGQCFLVTLFWLTLLNNYSIHVDVLLCVLSWFVLTFIFNLFQELQQIYPCHTQIMTLVTMTLHQYPSRKCKCIADLHSFLRKECLLKNTTYLYWIQLVPLLLFVVK